MGSAVALSVCQTMSTAIWLDIPLEPEDFCRLPTYPPGYPHLTEARGQVVPLIPGFPKAARVT